MYVGWDNIESEECGYQESLEEKPQREAEVMLHIKKWTEK